MGAVKVLSLAVLWWAASLAMSPGYAQSSGWMGGRMDTNLYLGANIGQSRFSSSCDNVPVSCDDKDTGWKALAGYRFHRNVALEAGYFNLGSATASGGGAFAEAKVRGWEVTGLAILPVADRFDLYARLGFARSRVSLSGAGISVKDNSTDFTYGLGAQYSILRNLAARAEWQRYDSVGGDNTGKDDIDLFSIGVLYKF